MIAGVSFGRMKLSPFFYLMLPYIKLLTVLCIYVVYLSSIKYVAKNDGLKLLLFSQFQRKRRWIAQSGVS
jgi:hypothetical protein